MKACCLKSLLIDLIEPILKNCFKKSIRPDSPYIKYENLTSLQIVIEKKAPSVGSCEKDQLKGRNKSPRHMGSQLRKAIMERSTFKNKENKIGEPADKTGR